MQIQNSKPSSLDRKNLDFVWLDRFLGRRERERERELFFRMFGWVDFKGESWWGLSVLF